MRLLGVPIPDDDAQRLAVTLMAGDEKARALSGRIINGLQRHVTVLALSHDERDALLAEHPQTRFRGVDVDAAMVPLLRELWRRGIRTVASCQGWTLIGGAAYVGFVTEEDYEAFRAIVLSASLVLVDLQPDSELRQLLRDPAYLEDQAENGGAWAAGFPPEDLRAVTAAARRDVPAVAQR